MKSLTISPIGHVHAQNECSVCGKFFERNLAKKLWVNYGGVEKLRRFCSNECCAVVIEICGENRVAKRRQDLKYFRKREDEEREDEDSILFLLKWASNLFNIE
jgi:hypothetical protein